MVSKKPLFRRGVSPVLVDTFKLEDIYCDLKRFSAFVRSIDLIVETIVLRPGDRASLQTAIAAVDRAIEEQAQRPPRHPATRSIARDLKETRRAALVQRFERLRGCESARVLDTSASRRSFEQTANI
jgi:hypothetical protein